MELPMEPQLGKHISETLLSLFEYYLFCIFQSINITLRV